MKEFINETKAFIKRKLGLCNAKGCYEKAVKDIELERINVKRCLCKKHLEKYKELFKEDHIEEQYKIYKNSYEGIFIGIDYVTEGEEKTSIIKIDREIKSKNKEEKEIERLENLLSRIKKIRVKKKLIRRINRLRIKIF